MREPYRAACRPCRPVSRPYRSLPGPDRSLDGGAPPCRRTADPRAPHSSRCGHQGSSSTTRQAIRSSTAAMACDGDRVEATCDFLGGQWPTDKVENGVRGTGLGLQTPARPKGLEIPHDVAHRRRQFWLHRAILAARPARVPNERLVELGVHVGPLGLVGRDQRRPCGCAARRAACSRVRARRRLRPGPGSC